LSSDVYVALEMTRNYCRLITGKLEWGLHSLCVNGIEGRIAKSFYFPLITRIMPHSIGVFFQKLFGQNFNKPLHQLNGSHNPHDWQFSTINVLS